jgi:hypothetical protein
MRKIILVFTVLLLTVAINHTANADRGIKHTKKADNLRLALIIGNSDYRNAPLRNPENDARGMAQALRKSGFEVTLRINASQRDMETATRSFGKKLHKGGVGLFYYAGHGIQVNGRNYLIPIGATIESETDVKYEAVDAGLILGKMEDAENGFNIVVLDACRNNPFSRSFRSVQQGLARMDAPKGSLIAYATAPGSVAADGSGEHGVFTKHLIKNIQTPGLTIEQILKRVRIAVVNETSSKQIPWESSSLMGNFYFHLGDTNVGIPPSVSVPTTYVKNKEEKKEGQIKEEAIKAADMFFDRHMWSEAIAAYEIIIRSKTTYNRKTQAYALYKEGISFVKKDDSETAAIIFKKLVSDYGEFQIAKEGMEMLNKL